MPIDAPDEMSSCSCSNSDDNSRQGRAVRLFGVNLLEGSMRKSVSLGNLSHYTGGSSNNLMNLDSAADGYLSDGVVHAANTNSRSRRKGVPWTEDEHRLFLLGLQKLGKGDWRGISKAFVTTRTPTQVASHAQKYFIRQSNMSKRKRRSSLFDISHDSTAFPDYPAKGTVSFVELELGERVGGAALEKIVEENGLEQDVRCKVELEQAVNTSPASKPSLWLGLNPQAGAREATAEAPSNIVKPIASLSTGPVRIDEDDINSKLKIEPSLLSLKLEEPLRHSAFRYGVKAPIQCT